VARWLFKQEPSCYSLAALERDGETVWDGVTNAAARIHLRNVRVGDEVFFYHTGDEKAVVGVMQVTADGEEPKVKFVRKLANPVPLAAIKADPAFANWELVRISRLSVMPVPDPLWKKIEAMAAKPVVAPKKKKKAAG
jgi:predicted RNA-binding protein with PUA-like domain